MVELEGTASKTVENAAYVLEHERGTRPDEAMRRDAREYTLGVALEIAREREGNARVDARLDDIQAGAAQFSRDDDANRQLALQTVASPYMNEAATRMREQLERDGYSDVARFLPPVSVGSSEKNRER